PRASAPRQQHDGEQERQRQDHAAPNGRHAPPWISDRCATTALSDCPGTVGSERRLNGAARACGGADSIQPPYKPPNRTALRSDRDRGEGSKQRGIPDEGEDQAGHEEWAERDVAANSRTPSGEQADSQHGGEEGVTDGGGEQLG